MVWDYTEVDPLIGAAGDITTSLHGIARVIEGTPCEGEGTVGQFDATRHVSDVSRTLISTDPPNYDNIGYSDLSDFFYVWLRRSLGSIYPGLFSTLLTPKSSELIASTHRHDGSAEKAQTFFEKGFKNAFDRLSRPSMATSH
jgi:putative DNA methylase